MSNDENQLSAIEVEAQLRRLKPRVADEFLQVIDVLKHNDALTQTDLSLWQNVCFNLADAGWHGWEAAQDYIRLSRDCIEAAMGQSSGKASDKSSAQIILSVGHYCLGIVGHSFEPGRNYLQGASHCLRTGEVAELATIEHTGRVLVERFQHASNLQASFFKTAFALSEFENHESLEAWCQLAELTCQLERQQVLSLFDLTQRALRQDWQSLTEVATLNHENALDCLQFFIQVEHSVGAVETELLGLAKQFSQQDQKIAPWLSACADVLPLLSDPESRTLFEALQQLDHVEQAAALVKIAHRLPLNQEWVVLGWLANRPINDNPSAQLAYLSLASAVSEQYLQELLGKVQLHEEQRTLQLFVEGLCGTRLRIEVGESLPNSDGVVVRLPAEVDIYATHAENYRWLKNRAGAPTWVLRIRHL